LKLNKCAICGEYVDKGECGSINTIITYVDDTHNKEEYSGKGVKKTRVYLCEDHSYALRIWISGQKYNSEEK